LNYSELLNYAKVPTIQKGMEDYFAREVKVFHFDGRTLEAEVTGQRANPERVDIVFSDQDCWKIEQVNCTCSVAFRADDCCRHIVAAALTAQKMAKNGERVVRATETCVQEKSAASDALRRTPPDSEDDENPTPRGGRKNWDDRWEDWDGDSRDSFPKAKRSRKTNQRVLSLLSNASVIKANRRIATISKPDVAPLSLEPTLHFTHYDGVWITLKFGANKLYLIKYIGDFIGHHTYLSPMPLGRDTKLVPAREAFLPESLPVLDFTLRHFRVQMGARDLEKRRIQLTPTVVDEFFALYQEGDFLKIEGDRYKDIAGTYRISEQDYPLRFRLEKEEDGARLQADEEYQLLTGRQGVYLLVDRVLYKCSPAYCERCRYFLREINNLEDSIFIAEQDIPNLYSSVIYDTEDFLHFDIDDLLTDMQPAPLVTKVYFDVYGPSGVKAHMSFSYGEKSHDAFDEKYLNQTMDLVGEQVAETLLLKYMGPACIEPGTLAIEEDEDALYELIVRGVDEIAKVAEIYASEDFEKIKVRQKMSVSIGIRVNGNLLEIDFDPDDIDYSELAEILTSYRKAKKYRRMKDGSFLSLEGSAVADLAEFTEGLDLDGKELAGGRVRLDMNRAPYIDGMLKKSEEIRYERDDGFKNIIRNMRDIADADFHPPADLAKVLRNYQKTGFRWLKTIDELRFGGILADDMGLGKTLEVLALLLAYKEGAQIMPSIVICPASVVLNWEAECARFTPEMKTAAMVGGKAARDAIIENATQYDLLITSYGQMVRDVDAYQGVDFRYVILDEAQFVKNQKTQSAHAVKQLKGRTKIALTGTPIENSLAELWSIFDFVMPGYLYSYHRFRVKYETQITKFGNARIAERLHSLVRPFILRRLKKDVLKELPEKTESVILTAMEGDQEKLYLGTLAQTKAELSERMAEVTDAQGQILILAALTKLRQICCDPSLVFDDFKGSSAKLGACLELVQNSIASGHRILLFSQFTSMMAILSKAFDREKIGYYYLDGSTPKHERMSLVNAFNSGDTPIFLISLKAGGTGLNLTGADVVIHYDPWWNLSVQNQATDRAHRIGQEKNVQVFKLIVKNSIEEKILKLQEKKAALAESVIKAGGNAFETLSKEELLALFEGD
jgi:SNF2 family DNA or RNA helicase